MFAAALRDRVGVDEIPPHSRSKARGQSLPTVAQRTHYETLSAYLPMLNAGGYGDGQATTTGKGTRSLMQGNRT
jgi:hypothetical protein